jgi:carboxyl-terminal processing protease
VIKHLVSSPAPWAVAGTAYRPLKAGRFIALSLTFLLLGCAARDIPSAEGYDASRAGRLFAMGYQDVSDIYIEDVEISRLAMAGLENLSGIDPEVSVQRSGDLIDLKVHGKAMRRFSSPHVNDADGWGQLTAAAIDAGRAGSPSLDAAESEGLYQAVFDGLTSQLDNFSRYAGREEANEHRASREGFFGIGVRIGLVDEGVKILSVMENTPAEAAGLQEFDVITHIDGEPAAGLSQRDVVHRLRGPLDTKVTLTIRREGASKGLFNTVVTRSHIVPQTVKYIPEGSIGYITVSGFNQSTARTLQKKVRLAQEQIGPKLAGLIIDLRNNPGGLLDQAVAVSDQFVSHGRIVSTHGRHPDSHQEFDADSDVLVPGIPIAVLVNGNSASASEIVAAALQDTGRAVVIGSSSFGKGTVQTVLRLPNEGELTLTWARFHAPSGYALHRRGVMPDICTSGAQSSDQVLEALRRGEQPIEKSYIGREIDPNDDKAIEAYRARCPVDEGKNDVDMQVAEALLTDPLLYARAMRGSMNAAQVQPDLRASQSR